MKDLKNNNNKNSSNSGKPSSTNGYKKVVTNNRGKSSKKRYEYDIEIKRIVRKHMLYPDVQTNIKNYPVVYGNNIKVI